MLPSNHIRRVYCAGPLFNQAERDEMVRIARALQECGFDTFVPHADGMEFALVQPVLIERGFRPEQAGQLLHEAIFALDVYQVVAGCGSLVFNMNGRVPDEGAVAEATIAWVLGKPVVIYKEDRRSLIVGRDNPLVVGQAGFQTVSCMEMLGPALEQRIVGLNGHAAERPPCPPHLEAVVTAGERLWNQMLACGALPGAEELICDVIIELFAVGSSCSRALPVQVHL